MFWFRKNGVEVDKEIEKQRFNRNARLGLKRRSHDDTYLNKGAEVYEYHVLLQKKKLTSEHTIVELFSGSGARAVESRLPTIRTDIAVDALRLAREMESSNQILFLCCDAESLPFPDGSVDLVYGAGGLSYINRDLFLDEIERVLKVNGACVFLDSPDDNLIFRLNRWRHFLLKRRTAMNLKNIWRAEDIRYLGARFAITELQFFGHATWLYGILRFLLGRKRAEKLCGYMDASCSNSPLGFKFLVVFRKK